MILRPARADDLDAIHQLVRRVEVADGIPIITPREELAEWTADPHLDFAADSRVAIVDGQIAGYGRTWYRPSDALQSRVFLMGAVDPAHRGRGIGRQILTWQLARGREILMTAPADLPRFLRTQAYDFERGAIALYERCGLAPVRWFQELLRSLPDEPTVPDLPGVDLVAWDAGRTEELRLLHNQAFADMWGSTPLDRDAWAHRLEAFGNRFDLSWMALAGGRAVSFALNACFPEDEQVTGRRDGWIRTLGTARAHRKRGIASALVLASCRSFRRAGLTHAALGVDGDSPTGAHLLYRRLGFEPMHRMVQHQLEVR